MKSIRLVWNLGFAAMIILFAMSAYAESQGFRVKLEGERVSSRVEDGVWGVRVKCDYPCLPKMLRESLEVTIDEKAQKFTLTDPGGDEPAKEPQKDFRLTLDEVPPGPVQLRVTVKKGLSDVVGRRVLAQDVLHTFIYAVPRVSVTELTTFFQSAKDKGVRLHFSRPISPRELKGVLKVTPTVEGLEVVAAGQSRVNLVGRFKFDARYRLEAPTVKLLKGRVVLQGGSYDFNGPGVKPQVSIRTKRFVVERKGRQLFPVTLENLVKMRVKLTTIPAFLAPDALREAESSDLPKALERIKAAVKGLQTLVKAGKVPAALGGEAAEDAEVFFAPDARDNVLGFTLPLTFRKDAQKGGVIALDFSDPDGAAAEGTRAVIQVTDLSITYKKSAERLLVWVTSLYTGKPVEGARIMLSTAEGVRFLAGKTDKDGILVVTSGASLPMCEGTGSSLSMGKGVIELNDLKWAFAATSDDASFMDLENQGLKPLGCRQVAERGAPPQGVRGKVFTERGVYKPGEEVFFKCAVRTWLHGAIDSPVGEQVKVTIWGPKEDVVYDKELTLGDFGTCHDSFKIGSASPVGAYVIKCVAHSESGLDEEFTHTFQVEEYKRPRHFVSLSLSRESRESKSFVGVDLKEELVKVQAAAQYYTGGPVKHGKARWKASLVPVTQKAPGFEGYLFGNGDQSDQFLESGESVLDEDGRLTMTMPLDGRALNGLFGIRIALTVQDVDGEPATDVGTFSVKPKFSVGVSTHPEKVMPGFEQTLKVIVVDSEGNRVPKGEIKASVMRRRSFRTQKRDDSGNIRYLWEEGWMAASVSTISLSKGEAEYKMSVDDFGDSMVSFTYEEGDRLYTTRTKFDVGYEYYRYGSDDEEGALQSVEEMRPSVGKGEYKPGDEVAVNFSAKRPLTSCLISVEQGDILEYRVIHIDGHKGTFKFTAGPEHQPNAYVSVLGVSGREGFPDYPSQPDVYMPTVHYGYAMVKVRKEVRSLNLGISPDQGELTGRPGEDATLSFKVTDHEGKGIKSELAVCVVDEAVLSLTRFQTPDLSSLKDFTVPLAIFGGDLHTALITQELGKFLAVKPLTGGGMGAGLVGPTVRKDFRPVAFFDPAVVTDEEGRARVEFKLPDSTTAYRVYAVACDKTVGFASGQRRMIVRKEFSVDQSLPRFLIPMDRAWFPITLFNKTDEEGEAKLEAQGSAGLTVRLTQPTVKLDPMSVTTVFAEAEALGGVDRVSALLKGFFSAKTMKYDDAEEKTIPIHSRYLPVKRVIGGSFQGKGEIKVSLPEGLEKLTSHDASPEDMKARLSLGTTNWTRIAPALQYLLHYPYGCIEQTASGVMPLAGMRDMVKAGLMPGVRLEQVDDYVNAGVGRIMSMQLNDGSFSYWPGNHEQNWWGTLYAVCALTFARNAGIDVPDRGFTRALDFIRSQIIKRGGDSSSSSRDPWASELGVYALAMNGKLTAEELKPFMEKFSSLSAFSRALLLLAAEKTGGLPREEIVRRLGDLNPPSDQECPYYFNSGYRAVSACLLAALNVGVTDQRCDTWAGALLQGLRPEGRWRSTADTGWCLLALSKYFQGQAPSKEHEVVCRIAYGAGPSEEVKIGAVAEEIPLDFAKIMEKGSVNLSSKGSKGLVHYTLSLTYPDVTSAGGETARGLGLQKRIENLNGNAEIKVGDVVRVTVDLEVSPDSMVDGYRYVEYLALEDPVPAGLVPINSELANEGTLGDQARNNHQEGVYSYDLYPSFMEFRDDGIRVFKNRLWQGIYRFSYLARAAIAGDFWMRGSRASLMYQPEVFGTTEGKKVVILPAGK